MVNYLRLLSEKRLKKFAFGEHLVWPARAPGRMDLSESGERLAQIYTRAGRPDDPYGGYHLLTLNYH
jgi:hypothetical protein